MKYFKTFIFAVSAGFSIGLGGGVFLRVLSLDFPGCNVVGAIFFTIGLFLVCERKYNLFTGKVCYVFDNRPSYLIDLLLIYLGNFAGTACLSFILSLTSAAEGMRKTAAGLVEAKMSSSLLSLYLMGIVCNVLIFFAVDGYKKSEHAAGKYLSLFFGVTVFILIGSEHSVADMFYFMTSGKFLENPAQSAIILLVITAGNITGGAGARLIEKIFEKEKSK